MWLSAVELFSELTCAGPLLPNPDQPLALLTRDPPRGKSTARYQVVWAQRGFSAPGVGCTDSQAVLGRRPLEETLSTFCACCLQFLQTTSLRQSKLLSISGPACEMAWLTHFSSLSWFCLCGAMQMLQPDGVTGPCHLLPKIPVPSTLLVSSDVARSSFFLTLGFILEIRSPLSMSFVLKIYAHILKIKVF